MTMSSQQPPSSRSTSTNMRVIALSVISFFVGLQFKNLIDLFGSGAGNANMDAAWAPDNFGEQQQQQQQQQQLPAVAVSVSSTQTQQRKANSNRAENKSSRPRRQSKEAAAFLQRETKVIASMKRHEQEQEQQHSKSKGKNKQMKKKSKPPRRFEASNYTIDFVPLPWTLPKPTPMRYKSSKEFMTHYIAAKRKKNIPLPWEQPDKYKGKNVTLPLPIIALNFPKSATLTLKSYFDCGGITSIHTSSQQGRLAICMMENQFADRPPMDGCNTHKPRESRSEVTPIDFISDIGLQGPPCYYPGVHDGSLDNIAKHYPDATIMLVVRNATSWHKSMSKWGSIMHRWKKYCHFDGSMPIMGGGGGDGGGDNNNMNMKYWRNMYNTTDYSIVDKRVYREKYWVNFYEAHMQKVREFAMRHPSMTYVEVELNDDMGEELEKYTGVTADCVMDCHPGPKWVKLHNAAGRCHPVGQNPALLNAAPEEAEEGGEEGGDGDGDDDETKDVGDDDDDKTEE